MNANIWLSGGKTMQDRDGRTRTVIRDVVSQGNLEERRLFQAFVMIGLFGIAVFVLLGIDYKLAHIMFSYLDPTLGDTSLGPAFLALSVPIAVLVINMLIREKQNGKKIELNLQRLAGIGVIVFLFGIASMVALVYFESTDGIGTSSSGISGTIGGQSIGSNQSDRPYPVSTFGNLLAGIGPIIFLLGMTMILFVTVYASHYLMIRIEQYHGDIVRIPRRAKELRLLYTDIEAIWREIHREEVALKAAQKKLPGDPERRFSQLASAAIGDALHRMKQSLKAFNMDDALIKGIFERKAIVPDEIDSREQGLEIIAEIRHATSPRAILKELDGYPTRMDMHEDEES